ncbi:hypothetical protein A2765_04110 [Candidatus Kaiserbacteria bacterium RIFCSPHIGHO2_01_FULL_56_24]|uniref:Uncharacterized protein n=1 Tax=Candidatus Kaiserbacteria bacterium RIFCSPHIGHO2_01_FULL_56_24 TaxID=1798487 RepID=A0A1F6DE93_9BACT|nr:MAG: hypothetical protein A2765_04110 [Candidatus Kaiserbacteria bacterium RIFCSPHIGHO2_01_FULL_56_24]
MNYLIEKGLLNTGLVELTPTMLGRYNEALVSLGIEPTARKRIFVDGAGWSHEVAREKKDDHYLCSGSLINPVAIIVTPAQYKKPVFYPSFSWMRRALRLVFDKYHREIYDTTTTHPITLDCENGLSSLECPGDLLLLSEIVLKPSDGNLTAIASEQGELIERFREGLNCLEPDVCDAIVSHRREHGDLRKRRLGMHPVTFDFCNDFYTVAFDGVAVIRSVQGSDMLIIEDERRFEETLRNEDCASSSPWYLYDDSKKRDPIKHLTGAGLIDLPLKAFRENPGILAVKKDLMLALALCDCEEGLDWDRCTPGKRKALYSKHIDRVPLIAELEHFAAEVHKGSAGRELSMELWQFLAAPAEHVPPPTQEVLWILLTRREPQNILELYTYDKNAFVKLYKQWSDTKQKWVAGYLAARYEPRMLQP